MLGSQQFHGSIVQLAQSNCLLALDPFRKSSAIRWDWDIETAAAASVTIGVVLRRGGGGGTSHQSRRLRDGEGEAQDQEAGEQQREAGDLLQAAVGDPQEGQGALHPV